MKPIHTQRREGGQPASLGLHRGTSIPHSQEDICYLPAREVLAQFKSRKLSPVEYLTALVERAERLNPSLKAFTFTHYDEALNLAKKAEARYAKPGARLRPLEGLPIGIKDESYIAGKPLSNGSLLLKGFVPQTTSVCNQRILDAGAIVLARTATPEFSCASFTHSKLWGVTRNPWNLKYTPGGSSGGSSAALAAVMAPLCTGSDIGGSIRIPASTAGLVGFKPPYGRNPDDPPFNLDHYNHVGPLARSVADCILLQNVMSGPSPTDIATVRPKITLPMAYRPIKGWKIAYSIDLGIYEVDREVARNTKRALDVFKSLGATIVEVDLGWTRKSKLAGYEHLKHLFGASMAPSLKRKKDLCAYTIEFTQMSKRATSVSFFAAVCEEARMYQSLGALLEQYDVFICPTTAVPAVKADFDVRKDKLRINNKELNDWRTLDWCMTIPFNSMGRCPVLSVPSGRAANNVPTGIQIVGRTFSDADVFRAAMAYETALGGWYRAGRDRPAL